MKLRKYQDSAVSSVVDAFGSGVRVALVVLPTGGGKTIVFASVAQHFLSSGRIMVMAHRDELVRQASIKIKAVTGVGCAIEKASEFSDEDSMHGRPPIVITSVQTQNAGGDEKRRMERFDPSEFSLLIIDEAHHGVSVTWRRVIDYYRQNPDLNVLLVTATADRADERGLSEICDHVAFNYQLPDIIKDGYLVPIRQKRVYIEGLEFSKIATAGDDLDQQELELAMMAEKPLHGTVQATIETACRFEIGYLETIRDDPDRSEKLSARLGENAARKTLVFTVSVTHAERVAEIINRWIPQSAACISGGTPQDKRREILRDYAAGEIRFLCNCAIALEGFDEPSIEIVAMSRPTKSRPLYSQAIGRGTRPSESIAHHLGDCEDDVARRKMITDSDKKYLEVLDFVGNSGRHKLVCTADILGESRPEEVIELAKEISDESEIDMSDAIDAAQSKIDSWREADAVLGEIEAEEADLADQMRVSAAAMRRLNVVATAQYNVKQVSAFDESDISPEQARPAGGASIKQADFLSKLGCSPETISKIVSVKQAGAMITSMKATRCTKGQAWRLSNMGYSHEEIKHMNFDAASKAIDAGKVNA